VKCPVNPKSPYYHGGYILCGHSKAHKKGYLGIHDFQAWFEDVSWRNQDGTDPNCSYKFMLRRNSFCTTQSMVLAS